MMHFGSDCVCMARFTSPKTKHMQMSENVAQRHFCVDDGGGGGGGGGGFTFGRLKKKKRFHHI